MAGFSPPVVAAGLLLATACQDTPTPTDPAARPDAVRQEPQAVEASQLQEWHGLSLELFEQAGVVFTDVDEENDRLIVAVQDLRLARRVEEKLERSGIPLDAVAIQQTAPIVLAAALTDNVRPLKGGLQVAFSEGICSLGFNAVRDGVFGYVGASHCTITYGGLDGTPHYQPTVDELDANLIGHEIVDPEFFQCAINAKECRYSDSAFDQLEADVEAELGHIARPEGVNTGSLNIVGSFRITSEASGNAPVGQLLSKVGRTTGWTRGEVTHSCAHVRVVGRKPKIFLCQDLVAASADAGDSGSPVFQVTNTETFDVTLKGILWGMKTDGTAYVYSPISNVQNELEDLDTCADTFDC